MRLHTTLAVLALLVGAGASPAAPRPNVMVLADDLGWADRGCYVNAFNEPPTVTMNVYPTLPEPERAARLRSAPAAWRARMTTPDSDYDPTRATELGRGRAQKM